MMTMVVVMITFRKSNVDSCPLSLTISMDELLLKS
jgi:hypothetical protein